MVHKNKNSKVKKSHKCCFCDEIYLSKYSLKRHTHTLHEKPYKCRPVVPGGAGGAITPPDFGRSVIPTYLNRGVGADYARQIKLAPPDFQTLLRL